MPPPPPIRLVNTGYVDMPDEENPVEEYNYSDPTDGEPFISPGTIAEDDGAWDAYMSRGQDEEMADANDNDGMEKSVAEDYDWMDIADADDDNRKERNSGGRNQIELSGTANVSTPARKRPGKASRMPPRSIPASLQDPGRVGDSVYRHLNIETCPNRSLLDFEDPSNMASLFRRVNTPPSTRPGAIPGGIGQQEYRPYEESDAMPFEVIDESNLYRSGRYGETDEGDAKGPSEPIHAGVDYHAHASLVGSSYQARDTPAGFQPGIQIPNTNQDAAQSRAGGHLPDPVQVQTFQDPTPTSGFFAAPGTAGFLPLREETDSKETGRKHKLHAKEQNPHYKDGQAKKAKLPNAPISGSSSRKRTGHH
ncbi:hypothetical protein P171DRAFT_478964 [Karstenula rhodostoma CBS 690.94]|uniref:Uncharacterized protein n=1 Tax=Karstenula rhodostoma CBS 690.94 TaxID=1392251 RepID=A0A9P4PV44_9PLEO|nr:hypothetical protein P171DRAFT_478964 [Karstenula rhodostoma CBS 690.94]